MWEGSKVIQTLSDHSAESMPFWDPWSAGPKSKDLTYIRGKHAEPVSPCQDSGLNTHRLSFRLTGHLQPPVYWCHVILKDKQTHAGIFRSLEAESVLLDHIKQLLTF